MIQLINPLTGQPAAEADTTLVLYAYGKGPYHIKPEILQKPKAEIIKAVRDVSQLSEILTLEDYIRLCADNGRKVYQIKYSVDKILQLKLIAANCTREAINIFEEHNPGKPWCAAMPLLAAQTIN